MKLLHAIALTLTTVFTASVSHAELDEALINEYNRVAQGESDQVEELFEQLDRAHKTDPADPVALFYFGASGTLMGRESWMPWNKLSYTENGLARMDKALSMLSEDPDQPAIDQLPQDLYLKASAAIVFTDVPEMFSYFERGYGLFQEVFDDPRFSAIPLREKTWIYYYAIKAADSKGDVDNLNNWTNLLLDSGLEDNFVQAVKSDYASS